MNKGTAAIFAIIGTALIGAAGLFYGLYRQPALGDVFPNIQQIVVTSSPFSALTTRDGNDLYLAYRSVTAYEAAVTKLAGCSGNSVLATDATGNLICDTDDSGASTGGTTSSWRVWAVSPSYVISPTTTLATASAYKVIASTDLTVGNLNGIIKCNANSPCTVAGAGSDYEVPLTFGDGLTRTVNDVDCDTADAATFGCLTGANWTTFNSKATSIAEIVAATKTKITYDKWGNVTSGADATTSDIAEGSNLYYTDARAKAIADVNWRLINRQGFVSPTSTTMFFNPANYTFSLSATGTTWQYMRSGYVYTITGSKTVTLPGTPPTAGTYYIYIDADDGTLSQATSAWTLEDSKVPVALLLWNDASTPKYVLFDERHTSRIDWRMQKYLHNVIGTSLISGGTIADIVTTGTTDDDNTFSLVETVIADQSEYHTLIPLADPAGTADAYHVYYRTAASTYVWEESEVPFRYTAAGYIQYDNGGTMTEGQASRFYNTYVAYTNATGTARLALIHGRSAFTSLANAQGEAVQSFDFTGFPAAEVVIAYRLTWETSNSYTTKGKVRLAADPQRISFAITSASTPGVITDHNALSSLQGGEPNEYYHLGSNTSAEVVALMNAVTGTTGLINRTGPFGYSTTSVLAINKGGTGLAVATDDTVPIGNGTAFQLKTIPPCAVNNYLYYDQTTNAFSCGAIASYITGSSTIPLIVNGGASGMVKITGSVLSSATDGTDYTLITAQSCAAGQHLQTAAANGDFTCGNDPTWASLSGDTNVKAIINASTTIAQTNGNAAQFWSGTGWGTPAGTYGDANVNALINASSTISFPLCAAGQIVEWSGTRWNCGADDTGAAADVFSGTSVSPFGYIYYSDGIHSATTTKELRFDTTIAELYVPSVSSAAYSSSLNMTFYPSAVSGNGKNIDLRGGNGLSGTGGYAALYGGNGTAAGGSVYVYGGDGTPDGNVILGNPGYVVIQNSASKEATFDAELLSANRRFQLPNEVGTFALATGTQTLTNKTMDYASNTFTGFPFGGNFRFFSGGSLTGGVITPSSTGITVSSSDFVALTVNATSVKATSVTSTNIAASTRLWCPVSDSVDVSSRGMFGIDTSEDQYKYFGTAAHVLSPTSSFSFAMASSTSFITDDPNYEKLLLRRAPYDMTITKISCATDAGTQVIGLYEAAPVSITNLATNGVDGTTTITCDSDGQDDDGTLSNPSIDRGDWVGLYFGTAASSPKKLSVSVEYVVTAK